MGEQVADLYAVECHRVVIDDSIVRRDNGEEILIEWMRSLGNKWENDCPTERESALEGEIIGKCFVCEKDLEIIV